MAQLQSTTITGSNASVVLRVQSPASSSLLFVSGSGNVGIGTTAPEQKLHVAGNISIRGIEGGTYGSLRFGTNNSTYYDAWAGIDSDWEGVGINVSNLRFYTSYGSRSERMRITAAGNVGIGTTAPTNALDVLGKVKIDIDGTYGGGYSTIGFGGTTNGFNRVFGNNGTGDGLFLASATGTGIYFRTNGGATDHMVVMPSGNVGIGETSPSARLEVKGSGTTSATTALRIEDSNASASMVVLDDGNVGIGTTAPGQKLQVAGNIALGSSANGYLEAGSKYIGTSYASPGTDGFVGLQLESVSAPAPYNGNYSQNIKFYTHHYGAGTGGTPRVTIQYDGNVGIGTTSPKDTLAVNGTIAKETTTGFDGTFDNFIKYGFKSDLEGTGQNLNRWIGADATITAGGASANKLKFKVYSGGSTGSPIDVMTLDGAGNVGIGTTSPQDKLTVKGATNYNLNLGLLGGYSGIYVYNDASSAYNHLRIDASPLLLNSYSGGNVGIGTDTPTLARLQVQGNVSASSFTGSFSGTVSAPGSTTQVVFNNGGVLGADSGLVYSGSRVGIGTTSPSASFHVNKQTGVTSFTSTTFLQQVISEPNGGGAEYVGLDFTGYNSTFTVRPLARIAIIPTGAGSIMSFGTSNSYSTGITNQALNILYNGNVGIGETSPSARLEIKGSGTTSATTTLRIEDSNASASMVVLDDGNVGIGTTSPTVALDVNGAINGGFLTISRAETSAVFTDTRTNIHTTTPSFIVQNTGDTSVTTLSHRLVDLDYAGDADTVTGTYVRFLTGGTERAGLGLTSDKFTITTGVTERLTIDASGNVGIGTTTPGAKLDVATNSSGTTIIVGRGSGQSSIKANSDNGGYLALDSTGGELILNHYSSANMWMVTGGGNVGIGTTSPGAKLQVSGTVATDSALADVNAYRIIKPNGGVRVTTNSSEAGAIKITYPVSYTNTMHRVKLNIYEYTTNESFTIYFGGYNYSPSSEWYNEFAYILNNPGVDRNFTVRFGHDGSRMVVYIGELASGWTYPQIFIEEVELGYSGQSSTWRDGAWSIDFEASAFQNVTRTISNPQATNWARNGSSTYYGFGNVGIGETSPTARLEVKGSGATSATTTLRIENSNASSSLTVLDNLNIGIGTDTPTYKLQVVSSDTSNTFPSSASINVTNSESSAFSRTAGINFSVGNGGTPEIFSGVYGVYTDYNTSVGGALAFVTNAGSSLLSEKMRITAAGNVGIGTTSPASLLHIGPATNFTITGRTAAVYTGSDSETIFTVGRSGVDYPQLLDFGVNQSQLYSTISARQFTTNENKLILQPNGGNVGIGTTSPGQKLSVEGGSIQLNANNAAANYYLILNKKSGQDGGVLFNRDNSGDWQLSNNASNGDLIFYSYGTSNEAITFQKATGNIGIGLSNPTLARLQVQGNVSASSYTGSLFGTASFATTAQTATTASYVAAPGATTQVVINSLGALSASSGFVFNAGNVGIGTTSPGYKLDVNGNTNITGNLFFNSNSTLQAARRYVSTAALSNAGYTVIGTVTGDALASSIRISLQGTTASTVINVMADILVNHYQDILITSYAGIYTLLTLRVISDNNELYSIEATTDSPNACTTYVEIFPLNNETVVFGGSAQTGTSLTHVCVPGINISATGGSSGNLAVGGNVGIGTTSPGSKLHVNGGFVRVEGSSTDQYFLEGVRTGGNTTLRIYDNSSVPFYDSYGSMYFRANQNGGSGGVIGLFGGNVGIGEASPTARLEVKGSGTTSATTTLRIENANASSSMVVLDDGNVGIGTTSPSSKLDVSVTPSAAWMNLINANETAFRLTTYNNGTNNGSSIYAFKHGLYYNTTENAAVTFYRGPSSVGGFLTFTTDNGAERMRIDASGNVGIGETSPTARLEIKGSGATSATTAFRVENSSATTSMVVLDNLNVGVGTVTPQRLFDVYNGSNSGIAASFGAQFGNGQFSGISFGYVEQANTSYRKSALVFERTDGHGGGGNASGKIHFLLNNNGATSATALTDAVVTIDSIGTTVGSARMGIGTRFPTATLHISGTVATQDLLRIESTTGAEYLYVSASGNVGIGTDIPTLARLQVQGNVSASSYTGSLFGTASFANNATSASFAISSSRTVSASYALTASFALNGGGGGSTIDVSYNGASVGTFSLLNFTGSGVTVTDKGAGTVDIFLPTSGSGGGGGTPGGADGQIQYNNGGSFGGAVSMSYDDINHRVGIGTSRPGHTLTVAGGLSITGSNLSSTSLRFQDSSGVSRHALYVSSSNWLTIGNPNYEGVDLIKNVRISGSLLDALGSPGGGDNSLTSVGGELIWANPPATAKGDYDIDIATPYSSSGGWDNVDINGGLVRATSPVTVDNGNYRLVAIVTMGLQNNTGTEQLVGLSFRLYNNNTTTPLTDTTHHYATYMSKDEEVNMTVFTFHIPIYLNEVGESDEIYLQAATSTLPTPDIYYGALTLMKIRA